MNQFIRRFRNLKMKYQVILYGVIIMTLVLLLILGACMIQAQILFQAIESSSQVITTKQEKRSIGQTANRVQQYLERKYQQAIYNLNHVDNFFEATLENLKLFGSAKDNLLPCKESLEAQEINFVYDKDGFCYQSLVNSDGITLPTTLEINNYIEPVSLLSDYTQLFSLEDDSQILLFDLPNPQIRISYPQNYQLKNYSIQQRPWFQYYENHSNSSLLYSPVFLSVVSNDLIMMVIKNIYRDGVAIGLTSQSLKLNDDNIEAIPINVLLADSDGVILLSSLEFIRDAKEQILIYNETYTGFNESDWNLIQIRSNNNEIAGYQCSGFEKTFCLFNKHFNSNVQIEAIKFSNENFILVVFVNVTFSIELEQQYKFLTNQLYSQILRIEWILILSCFIMIAITSFTIQILFLPLYHLMNSIKLHVKTLGNNMDKQILNMSRRMTRQSNIFQKLSIKFMSLQDFLGKNSSQKSQLCSSIEKFSYNRKLKAYDMTEIKKTIQSLDEVSPRTKSQKKIVLPLDCKGFLDFFKFKSH